MRSGFLDSNVILYAALRPEDDLQKADIALDLLKTIDYGVSAQTLAEVYSVMARNRPAIAADEIDLWIASLSVRPFTPVDIELVRRGIAISRRFRIAYYDGAIVAAAERLRYDTLYTEDLNDGQEYGSVVARNPFR